MLNKVFLQGRLVADPELRHTQSGIPVATLRLAVDRDFKSREAGADAANNADFFSVVAWRHTAEFVSKYFTKGRMALVEGRLQVRSYTDRDNNHRTATEVVADNIYFGDSRRDGTGGASAGASGGYPTPAGMSGGSYAPPAYPVDDTAPANDFAELSGDDGELPF